MPEDRQKRARLGYSSAGIEFTLLFGGGLLCGFLLDRHFNSLPGLTLTGGVIGFIIGIYRLARQGRQLLRADEQKRQSDIKKSPQPPGKGTVVKLAKAPRYRAHAGMLHLRTLPIEINFTKILFWIILSGLLAGLAGIMPTWIFAGMEGLKAELVAWAVVTAVMLMLNVLTKRASAKSAPQAAIVFMFGGFIATFVCLGGGIGLWLTTALPPKVLFGWIVVFYIIMLMTESIWLSRRFKRRNEKTA